MAVALQWHVATNADQPVVLATSRSAQTGLGEKDVLLVVCDVRQTQNEPTREAADLARFVLDAYHAHEANAARLSANAVAVGANTVNDTNGGERGDVAQWLADAITSGVRVMIPANPAAQFMLVNQPMPGETQPTWQPAYAVVAAVIHQNTLFVARYGGGQVYLLRNGALQHLTDESFVGGANVGLLEPDLGQLDLTGEDRILLCNEGFSSTVYETQLRNVLRSTPSSRRAAQTLLDVATRDDSSRNGNINVNGYHKITSLAVADFVTGRAGVFPNAPVSGETADVMAGPRRGTFRSIAAVAVLIALIGSAVFAIMSIRNRGVLFGRGTAAPGAPTATVLAVQPISVTVAATNTSTLPTPTLPATAAPTATPLPQAVATRTTRTSTGAEISTTVTAPEPTSVPTLAPTLEPTRTPTSVIPALQPTETPTRRPRPRPTQTPTPVPPTATPIPPTSTVAPTATLVPPPPSNGGGGGGGGQPPPPCPPGATCS